ncbi:MULTISPECIES: DUF6668 family protein [Actinotignum]|uniref:Uncharacterized protein n=2 Tax=Actinotignum TaxID=1653174 RepID=S2WHB4_9ACTO|nr:MULTISPECIES: DUF6668 family protein [Actinotignum]EPD27254.1 hypothetical protein HMPREF9237_00611 [Actinotignum schaalii FB123-CNA-2]MDY5126822.1 DUF6668 family protein [Actinotignum sp. SLA_B059]MDY5136362.1 DUF6668 family protein [Actinotignum sanguinis]MDY5145001.1 DUF6668 family protein [Actinotignum timonense]
MRKHKTQPARAGQSLPWGQLPDLPGEGTFLPCVWTDPIPAVFAVGASGGVGTTTLASLCGLVDFGRAWPVSAPQAARCVVVARTTATSMAAARECAGAVFGGRVAGVECLGLVLVADQPGRLPRELARARALTESVFPRAWVVPYSQAIRLGKDDPQLAAHKTVQELRGLANVGEEEPEVFIDDIPAVGGVSLDI